MSGRRLYRDIARFDDNKDQQYALLSSKIVKITEEAVEQAKTKANERIGTLSGDVPRLTQGQLKEKDYMEVTRLYANITKVFTLESYNNCRLFMFEPDRYLFLLKPGLTTKDICS
jgi:hypothetical protein